MAKVRTALVLVFIVALVSMTFIACSPSKPTLSTSSNPDSGGTINPASGTYDKGVGVDIVATPASGYRFDHWEGSASGQSPTLHLTMDGNKNLTAYFTKTYIVSVSSTPANSGSVSPNDGTYDEGKEVTLAATPAEYYKFNGWSGDASGSSDHLTMTMDSNKTIVASFVKLTYTVQTQVDASGGGTVDPASGTFEAGTHVNITATPASGYRFDHWGGSTTSTTNPLSLLVDGEKTVTAYFTKTYTLTVSGSPNGSCTVDPSGGVYDTGTVVTLNATALFPYAFDHWSNTDNNTVNPTTVTMNGDKSVMAYFHALTPGAQQTETGTIYNDGNPMPTISLQAGQWVEVGIYLGGGVQPVTQVLILDPTFALVKDLGVGSTFSCTFLAMKTGSYTVKIYATFYGLAYTVNYTIYS
jgi:hypothetical protein